MGATFFMILMAIVFSIAVFFIVLSITLIVVWNIRKRRGKNPRKWWLVAPTILLIINVIVALLPVGYVGFLRYANNSAEQPIVYADSKKVLYWPMDDYEPTTNYFEMGGVKYVRFREGFSDESFFLDYGDERLGKPVANIKYDPSDSSPFNDFMWVLLSGRTYSEQNVSTVYPVANDNNFDFYYVGNSPGSASRASGTFFAENSIDSIKAYYADVANYDTQNIVCDYTVFADSEGWTDQYGQPHKDVKENLILNPEVFNELQSLYDSHQALERVDIPQKYLDIQKAAVPGTSFWGYDKREIFAYSKDKMAYEHVILVLIDGQVYVNSGSGAGYITCYTLSDELNQYIVDTIFVNNDANNLQSYQPLYFVFLPDPTLSTAPFLTIAARTASTVVGLTSGRM